MAKSTLGEWGGDVQSAKELALKNQRPLVVVSCNTVGCGYCKAAEAEVFSKQVWKDYAKSRGVPQYLADGRPKECFEIRSALNAEYRLPVWPAVVIFRVLDTADLTTTSLNEKPIKAVAKTKRAEAIAAQNPNVEMIGKFIYRQGHDVNGIKVDKLSPENFIAIIESFYAKAHPEWLKGL